MTRLRSSVVATLALLAVVSAGASPAVAATGEAPGYPGDPATWTTGAKQGIGTSATTDSKVWFTLASGILTEVYYPRVDRANSRALELVVTDGRSFADLESRDTTHEVELVDSRALIYRQVNTDRDGRYRIEKTWYTDPARSTVLVDIELTSLDRGAYTVYALYDPSLDDSGQHDTGSVLDGALVAEDGLGNDRGETGVASALLADRPFSATSNGFAGASDGWIDLADDFTLDDTYDVAYFGNLVQTARLDLAAGRRTLSGTLALGFGETREKAVDAAASSLVEGTAAELRAYERGWRDYLGSVDRPPARVRGDRSLATQYRVAAMGLKALEDKTYRGGTVAALALPWGETLDADEIGDAGDHVVRPRDLYQVATAQLAIGDPDAANRTLDYLFEVQQKPDGAFPQESLLDGVPYGGGLGIGLDETALPIVLAWQLERTDPTSYAGHVKPAADFIVANGPTTVSDRWREVSGYSPAALAAQVAGLTAAADIARVNNDADSAAVYTGVADGWQRRIEEWTYTTTGPLGDGHYYERVDGTGDPDDAATVELANGGGTRDEREIVDAGFLELVRLGVVPPNDAAVASSLPEVNSLLRGSTPDGDLWHRYPFDGYGDNADGSPFDGAGVGGLWPLLGGERGEYELANGRSAESYLQTMAATANDGYLIPEQVRDGEASGSASPIAWSLAQFLRLAVSIDAGTPVEMPTVVAGRYAGAPLPSGPVLELDSPTPGSTTGGSTVTVSGTTSAPAVYVSAGGRVDRVDAAAGAFSTETVVDLGVSSVSVVAVAADGTTALDQRTVTSTDFGTPVGSFDDAVGDGRGPGSYLYPTDPAFVPGAFDITSFGVYEAGDRANFVFTIVGEITNPWDGDQLSVQRIDLYLQGPGSSFVRRALPGTWVWLPQWGSVISASGFDRPSVRDSDGRWQGDADLFVLPESRRVAVSVPKALLGPVDLATVGYQVMMMSYIDEGAAEGGIRPVYSRAYWLASAGTDREFVQRLRFGGGAGEYTTDRPSRDTDSLDPNVLDILGPASDLRFEQVRQVDLYYRTLDD